MAEQRTIEQQAAYRFGYAASLLMGAEEVGKSNRKPSVIFIPGYCLIGFALENAFAAFLIAVKHDKRSDYKSHNLIKAMNAAAKQGLIVSKEGKAFVEKIAPLHVDFAFRYPEKMEEADLSDLKTAYAVSKSILKDVDTVLKMKGVDLGEIVAAL